MAIRLHTQEAFADMTVYRLDGLALAQDQLSEGLPSDPAEAARSRHSAWMRSHRSTSR